MREWRSDLDIFERRHKLDATGNKQPVEFDRFFSGRLNAGGLRQRWRHRLSLRLVCLWCELDDHRANNVIVGMVFGFMFGGWHADDRECGYER